MNKPHTQVITKEKGTIQHISADTDSYGIAPDNDPGTRYAPTNLADEFRKDGLRVIFSGKVGKIPPDARLTGTPIELTKIEELE
jgi:hypothetical protein